MAPLNLNRSLLKKFINLGLALQMMIEPSLVYAAQSPDTMPASSSSQKNPWFSKLENEDPIWQEFLRVQGQADKFELKFSKDDPAIDKDPFFLRSQNWKKIDKTPSAEGISFRKLPNSVELAIPEYSWTLEIQQGLTPFAITDEFIFFSVDKNNKIFVEAAGSEEKPGEGIFFIHRRDLLTNAIDQNPVPIFHFPLPGNGWQGTIAAHEIPQADLLAIESEEGNALSIELKDVETLMKAQQINLLLAAAVTIKNASAKFDPKKPILPAPGSTAAFGMFFTGLSEPLQTSNFETALKWVFQKMQSLPFLASFQSDKAEAMISLAPDFVARIVFVGSVLTGMLALSVVLKYFHKGVKNRIKEIRSKESQLSQNPPKTKFQKLKRELREIFDVYAHTTTTSAQFPAVTVGNALDLFTDRFMPSIAAADHTLIRRFMKNTFLFARDSVLRAPVNAMTLFLGWIIMGDIDSFFVALQYFWVVPWLCQYMAQFGDEAFKQRIEAAFDPHNPNTAQIATMDTIRNVLAYAQNGASSYSIESRGQVIEAVTDQVDSELRKTGLNPKDPANQGLRKEMIEKTTDLLLQQRGLPSAENFLYDADTIHQQLPKSLGYFVPEDLNSKGNFILAKRWGLTKAALERAIKNARSFSLDHPTVSSASMVRLLEETQQNMNLFTNGLTHGMEGIKMAKSLRQQLTLLSYEGPLEWVSKYLPETWKETAEPEAVNGAALFFRQSLYSLLSQKDADLLNPTSEKIAQFSEEAKLVLVRKMQAEDKDLSLLAPNEALKSILNSREMEFEVRLKMETMDLARKKAAEIEAANYIPAKPDWFTNRQLQRTQKKTEAKLGETLLTKTIENGSAPNQEEVKSIYRQIYRDELGKEVGLHFLNEKVLAVMKDEDRQQYKEMMAEVEQEAEQVTTSEIQNDENLKSHLSKISPIERHRTEVSMYATNFLTAYQKATTQRQLVSPLSPAQPGAFQALRQKTWVSKSRVLTRFLRTMEAFGDDQALTLGLHSSLSRKVPLFGDLWSSHRRLLKRFLPSMTTTYLWNYYVWQIHIPFATSAIFSASTPATIETPSLWLNRAFRLNGLKPTESVKQKALFAIPYAWLTFAGMIPMVLYSSDVSQFIQQNITDPFLSVASGIDPNQWHLALGALGAGVIAKKVMNVFKEKRDRNRYHKEIEKKLALRKNEDSNERQTGNITNGLCQKAISQKK